MVGCIECCELPQLKHTYLKREVIRESPGAAYAVHQTGSEVVASLSGKIRPERCQ